MDQHPSNPLDLRDCIDNLNSASTKAAERGQARDGSLELNIDWSAHGELNGHAARTNSGITNVGPTDRL